MTDDHPDPTADRDGVDKRTPLRRIAEVLGISKMTVSRALREGTSVNAELRSKVQEIARQIGYQSDSRISQVMSAIRKSQTPVFRETVALIGTHRRADKDGSSYFFNGIFTGANLRAQQLGFKLDDLRITDQAISGRALSRILQSRGIRGVLIAPPSAERTHPHIWLDWKKFCCVLIGRSFANTGVPRVQPDHYLSCVLAMRRLKRLRYRRIGLVLSYSMDERTVRMARSAFLSFHPMPMKECEKLFYTSDRHNPKSLAKWMEQSKPEVVIVNFESPFPRLEHFMEGNSAKVDLVALNWNKEQPQLAGIDQQLSLIAEHAVDLLSLRLQRHLFGLEYTAPTINVPGVWKDGPSVRAAALRGVDPSIVNEEVRVKPKVKSASRRG